MKKISSAFLAFLALPAAADRPLAVPGEYLVQSQRADAQSIKSLTNTLSRAGLEFVEAVNPETGLLLARAKADTVMTQSLAQLPGVEFIEPNYYVYAAVEARTAADAEAAGVDSAVGRLPNDPSFGNQWALRNRRFAPNSGTGDISAVAAWTMSTGSREIVVGIVDTGIDANHPDLQDNLWSMPGNPNVHGYNAINNTLNPHDDNGHGTHCAGTIGASGNNGIGIAGVAWNVRLMALKFMGSDGSGSTSDAIKAIDWGVEHGVRVLSNSWGGSGYSQALGASIARAASRGVVFIAAAGNDGRSNDASPTYPASLSLDYPSVITVASSTETDGLSNFSNYSVRSVQIMAPGSEILSTYPGGRYQTMSGTSMATPHVAGAVALLLSREGGLSPSAIRTRLMNTADRINAASGRVGSGGRLNVNRLLLGR